MSFLPKISLNITSQQLIYSILVFILIPIGLFFNTWFILRGVDRDIDFELRNKALMISQVMELQIRDSIGDGAKLQNYLNQLIKNVPEVRAIEVFKVSSNDLSPLISTSSLTQSVADPALNQLAWGQNQAYSKKITASLSHGPAESVWLIASPLHDQTGQKIGLVNLYLSAEEIYKINKRTTQDSQYILYATLIIVVAMLLYHFHFFEISILFKRLTEIDKLKDDFVAMASHELKTPLTVISGYSYLLMKNPTILAGEQLKKYSAIIFESSERLKKMVEEILDVSRIEQKRLIFNMVHNDLRAIISSVVAEMSIEAQKKGLRLSYLRPDRPLIVVCDLLKMRLIFANLVSNAVKYTPKGEVVIYHKMLNDSLQTFVKDSGIGMSQTERAKLFSKFYRVYSEQTKDIFGTGLGLWITKKFVERMNGTITVDSIEGQGSQFCVTFPLKSLPKV